MKVSDLLQEAARKLQACGVDEAELDARLLFEFVTGMTRTEIILWPDKIIEPVQQKQFFALLAKRCGRLPLHYITETREFWSLDFLVSPAVLIPRPETEFLLTHVLKFFPSRQKASLRALDMCTGSGIIATVLERELGCEVTAVDISLPALLIARQNVVTHCSTAGHFICSDLFSGLKMGPRYNLIVSNPPYVVQKEIEGLEPEVAEFEPRLALDGGEDGLDIIRVIISSACDYLLPDGWLFLEIGDGQGDMILQFFHQLPFSPYEEIKVISDWSGRERVVQAKYRGK